MNLAPGSSMVTVMGVLMAMMVVFDDDEGGVDGNDGV